MALELVKLDSGTLPAIANAIRAKTGDTALLLPSQMPNAIAGIPSGIEIPALTTPAAAGDVIARKEYIDGAGAKQTGTLVVCDTVVEAGTVSNPGVGLEVDIESIADASAAVLTLPEPNLKPENIKSGISIFHVAGSVKEIRTETGTWTPTEEKKEASIACTAGAKAFCLEATEETIAAISGQTARYIASAVANFCGAISGAANCAMYVWMGSSYANAGRPATNTDGFYASSSYNFYAGAYRWTAYYWDD